MSQISLHNICKTFYVRQKLQGKNAGLKSLIKRNTKVINALSDLSFDIEVGELIGYIGPNGAGKSTTVKIMSGILTPESGECKILGRIPWKDRIKHVAQIGVVFGQRSQLWWDVAVDDSFDLLKDIYDIDEVIYKKRSKELIDILNIGDYLQTPVRQLSLGQRMRCEIAASLLHQPKILFLDEPTIGLDAVSKLSLREFLTKENKQYGITMILTTHDMADIQALCSRVMVIGKGRLLYDGKLQELKEKYAPLRCLHVTTSNAPTNVEIPYAEKIIAKDNKFDIWFDPKDIPSHKMTALVAEKIPINDMFIKEKNIDEIIADMYKEMSL